MIATANTVRYMGATIKHVDADDPDLVAAAITPRTQGIIVVRTYGHPATMDRLREIATVRKILLIEDGAEAQGAFDKRRVGGLGTGGTFSFYANKIVTTGEGGMVTTNDPELYKLARRPRDHAFSPERHFWHEYVAFNYRMTNLQAAIELAQTVRLEAT
jgi:perosamine synthetase